MVRRFIGFKGINENVLQDEDTLSTRCDMQARHTRRRRWWWWRQWEQSREYKKKKRVLNTHSIDTHRMNDTIYLEYQWWWDRETWNAQYISMSLFALFFSRFASAEKPMWQLVRCKSIAFRLCIWARLAGFNPYEFILTSLGQQFIRFSCKNDHIFCSHYFR